MMDKDILKGIKAIVQINKRLNKFNSNICKMFGDKRIGLDVYGGFHEISDIISENYETIHNMLQETNYAYLVDYDGDNTKEDYFYDFADGDITFEKFIKKYPLKEEN